ncbi:MAG: LysR family transcriptional regulator, partial [Rhodospirillales bacterium]
MNNDDPAIPEKLSQATALLAAIARDGSFSKAAERLGVHQSAVSHRVRGLEEALGMPLFERTTRKLALTDAGEILCTAATRAMAEWQAATDQLRRNRDSDGIRLSLPSSLAMKWLLPALPRAVDAGLDIAID